MADPEHLAILKQGVDAWNEWREINAEIAPDLSRADLSAVDLPRVDLSAADLSGANLFGANLSEANLFYANLSGADLSGARLLYANLLDANLPGVRLFGAVLSGANLTSADLSGADLSGTNLFYANLSEANLSRANLSRASLFRTILASVDLSQSVGLDQCSHNGPSTIDHRTLQRSGPLPFVFLRGVGLPDMLIDYLPTLLNQAIQFYSCFISYSSKNQAFAERLYADLQNKGVRCWFAPHDMPIGAKILDAIDEAIRLRDKVLLILSEGSVASDWVEGEVTRALDEERSRKQVVLFPVRIDDAVMHAAEPWARLLWGQRNIGDFTRWKEHDAYRKALDRLVRDLSKARPNNCGGPSPGS